MASAHASAFLAGLCLLGGIASAQSFNYFRIADTSTVMPGHTSTFRSFGEPSLDGTDVAFVGSTLDKEGIYRFANDALATVVDSTTTVPSGGGSSFGGFRDVTVREGDIAFLGWNNNASYNGVFRARGGAIHTLVDTTTKIPGRDENFVAFSSLSFDGQTAAFVGDRYLNVSNTAGAGIYAHDGALKVIADERTLVPGGSRTFDYFSTPSVDDALVAFGPAGSYAESSDALYIGSGDGTGITPVLRRADPVPHVQGNLSQVRLDGESIVYYAFEQQPFRPAVFAKTRDGTPVRIAYTGMPLAGGGTMQQLGNTLLAVEDGTLTVSGTSTNGAGAFMIREGIAYPVLRSGDLLDGRTVAASRFQQSGLSHNALALTVQFTDRSSGIYVALPAGDTQGTALLPVGFVVNGGSREELDRFFFRDVPRARWYDPPVAEGFRFAMVGDSLFTEIMDFPTGFGSEFAVSVGGVALPDRFGPGDVVSFAHFPGGGVREFVVSGIEPLVDPEDPLGFPIKLNFNSHTASFEMIPINVPDPTWPSVLLVVGPLLVRRARSPRNGGNCVGLSHRRENGLT